MLIDLTDVFTTEGKTVEKQLVPEMNSFSSRLGDFAIKEKSPFQLVISNIGSNKVLIEGQGKLVFAIQCDRCLKEVDQTIELSFSREALAPSNEKEPLAEDKQDEQNFMEGSQLNAECLISNEIFMNWPMKVLCRADCKGICRQCGKDLNDGECGCDTFVPDPRMAKIKDIFNGK